MSGRTIRAAAALAGAAALLAAAGVAAQMKVGVILSATGPTAIVGIPQKNTIGLLPRAFGAIKVDYLFYDDASDPAQTIRIAHKLRDEDNVDAIIGPSGSPNAVALMGFVADEKTPLLAPVGTTAVVLPMDEQRRWIFKTTQNDDLIAEALVHDMVRSGVKTVGFIGLDDPYGELWRKAFVPIATAAGIRIVSDQRFARTDQSVTGQVVRLIAAAPDAVLVAAAGGSTVLPHVTLVERGYRGRIYQTHGAATPDFIRLGGKSVEGAIMAASSMLVLDQIGDEAPWKRVATDYIAAYQQLNGAPPATFGANVYDAGLLLQRAVPLAARSAAPGTVAFRSALRDALEQTRDLTGSQGVYTMTPQDHSGFDRRGRVLMTLHDGRWRLLPD